MKTIYTTILILFCATLSFAQNTVNYQYDNEGRIIHSDDGTKVQVYQYDNLGNRTSYTINSNATSTIDLTLNSISIPNTTVAQGQSYTVSCTAQNLGTTTAGTTILKVYLSPTNTGTQTLLTTYNVPNINANSSENLSFTVSIPTTANLGNQFLVFFIDANTTITETDETNNKDNIAVTVTVPNLAELNVQNASLSANNVQAGNSIDLTATVHNEGTVTANNFTVKSYLSNNVTFEANDILLSNTTENITSLTANNNVAYNKTVLIPSNTIAGNYYILFVVDEANTVTEVDETNNVSAVSVIVTNTSTAPVADFMANSTNIAIDGTIQFTDQSTNDPTSWQWTFEGGTPSTSTQQNPQITYNIEGVYDVTLVVTNSNGDSTELKNDYITVNQSDLLTYVPDDNFEQALIDLGYDDVLDDYVVTSNINVITSLNVSNKNISDMTGIEDFVALTGLYCGSNQLTSLDVSANTALTTLYCSSNQLTAFDVSSNTALTNLYCSSNQLSSLDISNNTILEDLLCDYNQLTELDISQNIALTRLVISGNQISSIDISQHIDLVSLGCSGNDITTIDVSTNINLTYLHCSDNLLTSLDLSANTALTTLYCFSNQLTALDVSANTALILLSSGHNQLTSLDIRNGNNAQISGNDFRANNNPNLTCIFVDDATYSASNWTIIDSTSTFVETEAACTSLGIEDEFLSKKITIYPNPTNDIIYIQNQDNLNIKKITVYNVLGKQILQVKDNTNQISTKTLTAGIYFMKIETEKGSLIKKIMKK